MYLISIKLASFSMNRGALPSDGQVATRTHCVVALLSTLGLRRKKFVYWRISNGKDFISIKLAPESCTLTLHPRQTRNARLSFCSKLIRDRIMHSFRSVSVNALPPSGATLALTIRPMSGLLCRFTFGLLCIFSPDLDGRPLTFHLVFS